LANYGKIGFEKKENILISFAQFRPEKDQRLQLEIFSEIIQEHPQNDLKFVLDQIFVEI
jgi:hypothetical protein